MGKQVINKCFIDQSGKIENAKDLTVVAYSSSKSKSLKISATEIFAALVFISIKDEKNNNVVIDVEYEGHEGAIKNFIKNYYLKYKKSLPNISFELITRKSPAYKVAIDTFRGFRKDDMILNTIDVLGYLFETKKIGWRTHSR